MKAVNTVLVILNIIIAGVTLIFAPHFLFVGLIMVTSIPLSIFASSRAERVFYLKRLSRQIDHIFVVSNHPQTDDVVLIPGVQRYIRASQYIKTAMTVREVESDLLLSGNLFWKKKGKQKLKVIPIIFQDGKYRCESWEDFHDRVKEIIKSELEEWHNTLKSVDPIWYDKYCNLQLGITYELNV